MKTKLNKIIILLLSLVLAVTIFFGIITSQNITASAHEFCHPLSQNTTQEICPDRSIMQHARSLDLTREFYLDRIYVIMRHRYSASQSVSRQALTNQARARSRSMREPVVYGWIDRDEVITNDLINYDMFNQ